MPKLKELFKLNIEEPVSLVVKAADQEQKQVEKEISEYIVTNQIESHLETFFENYTLNSTEKVGVWISGFFGSGKSYFAKILGYLITNPPLGNGLTAYDRFRERLNSSTKKDFIELQISKAERIPVEVVLFEIISDTSEDKGESIQKVLLRKLFGKLGYSKYLNVSSMEFELQEQNLYEGFKNHLKEKDSAVEKICENPGAFRKFAESYLVDKCGYTSNQAEEFLGSAVQKYSSDLSPSDFTDICMNISEKIGKRIVFIVDEMGAYVTSKGDDDSRLLQLQGISENFASKGKGKLWLIITSQEKLDQISHVAKKRSKFSKIVDRFSVKLDLTSENVDEVIRKKMLAKKPEALELLKDLFNSKNGNIQTISDTKSKYPKTDSSEIFEDYYPFFNYQFKLLTDLIESPYGATYAEANERKLIAIVDVILKKLKEEGHTRIVNVVDLFDAMGAGFFGSGTIEHFKKVDEESEEYLKDKSVKPSDVMKALNIISKISPSGSRISPNEEILARMLVSDLNQDIYKIKEDVRACVNILKDSRQITVFDGVINIVSDVEKDLMNFMENQTVSLPEIKDKIVERLKNIFNFNFPYKNGPVIPIEWSYNGERKWGKSGGIVVNIAPFESKEEELKKLKERLEFESGAHNEFVYIIPSLSEVEKKVTEIIRLEKALRDFQFDGKRGELEDVIERYQNVREEKLRELEKEMQKVLDSGMILYQMDLKNVDGNAKKAVREIIESRVIEDLYPNITSEKAKMEDIKRLLKEPKEKLFSIRQDEDHVIFDKNGEIIEGHKLVKPIIDFLQDERKRGADVLEEFSKPPYGWTYETIIYSTTGLLRGGKVKVNDNDDYGDPEVFSTLTTQARFKSAFISLNVTSISPQQKESLSVLFKKILPKVDIGIESPTSKFFKVGKEAVKKLKADAEIVEKMLEDLGSDEKVDMGWLERMQYSLGRENTEALNEIFERKDEIVDLFSSISEKKSFFERNSERLKRERAFMKQVSDEMEKSSIEDEEEIKRYIQRYREISRNIIQNSEEIQNLFEKIRNEYKVLFTPYHEKKAELMVQLKNLVDELSKKKNKIGEVVEEQSWFLNYKKEAENPCTNLEIRYSTACENCKHGLYETQLLINKIENDLKNLTSKVNEFMKKEPILKVEEEKLSYEFSKKIKLKKRMTYAELKSKVLEAQMEDDKIIEIEVEE